MRIIAIPLLAGMLNAAACANDGPRVTVVDSSGRQLAAIRVEIADTEAKRELGLMYRKQLGENAGMLFVFKQPQHQVFWMKNTEIPLDMIFADGAGRIVGIVRNAEPFSLNNVGVDGDSQYVVEVNGGFCERHRISAGDRLGWAGFVPRALE